MDNSKEHLINRLRGSIQGLVPWVVAIFFGVSLSWIANGTQKSLEKLTEGVPPIVTYVVLILLAIVSARHVGKKLFLTRTRYLKADLNPEPCKHLIIFLSYLSPYLPLDEGIPKGFEISGDLDQDIKTLERLKETKKPVPDFSVPSSQPGIMRVSAPYPMKAMCSQRVISFPSPHPFSTC